MSSTNTKQNMNFTFTVGEKILCEQKVLIYEAKILKKSVKDGLTKFLVHYSGWSKNHDEWVTTDRMLKLTQDNLNLQNEVVGRFNSASRKKVVMGNGITVKKELRTQTGEDSKRKSESSGAESELNSSEEKLCADTEGPSSIKKRKVSLLNIPVFFYSLLDDENNYINLEKMLYHLPSNYTVERIVDEYKAQIEANKGDEKCKESNSYIDGLKEGFNTTMGSRLLYKFERHQYSDILAENPQKAASQIYGAPHLIRFLVYMDTELQNNNTFAPQSIECLRRDCQNIIDFISSNYKKFVKSSICYNAPPEYLRRSF